jgi:hypothetical protein
MFQPYASGRAMHAIRHFLSLSVQQYPNGTKPHLRLQGPLCLPHVLAKTIPVTSW